MNVSEMPGPSRRAFLGNTGLAVAASALAEVAIPAAHAGENHTIQLALVGCGGRGTGAAANETLTSIGGDAGNGSPDRAVAGYDPAHVDVPPDRRFLGFDAYKKAMDCLRPGDVVLLTMNSQAPVHVGKDGRYPLPQPGILSNREFEF